LPRVQEKYLPYFAERGYSGYSLSLRGQGGSDPVTAKVAGTLASHAADVAHFVASLPQPPVVVAHSFGGIIAQK
jgi:pimeloyl-ACP methyl ester carboxylesterase